MMNQKEAVFAAISNVLGDITEGIAVNPTKEQRAQINAILFEGFRSGKVTLDKTFNDADLKTYVSGLTSNWVRKDTRLNGGIKYAAKNPGSRQGNTDPGLKAMRALLGSLTVETEREEVQGYIDARLKEIASTKVAKVIDFSVLPANLAAKFQK
jgi:hypothetical protein